jgi:hypothetical protein
MFVQTSHVVVGWLRRCGDKAWCSDKQPLLISWQQAMHMVDLTPSGVI